MCWHKKLKRICPLVVVASAVLPQLATTSDVSERRDRVRPNKESQSAVCLKRKNSALSEGSIVGNAIVAKELPNLGALLFHSQSGEDEEIVRALGDSEEILDCAPNSAMQRVLGGSFKKFDASNYSTAAHAANRRLQYWRPTPIIDSARATVWNTAPAVPGVHPVTQAQHAPLGTRPLMGAPILNPYSTAPGPLLRPNGQHPPGSILRPVTGTAGGQVQQVHHPGAPPVGRIPVLVAPVAAPAMSQVTNVAAPAVATTAARATGSVVNSATYSAAVAANRATYTNNVMYSGANRANNMLDKYNQLKQQDPNNEFVGIVESMNTIFKGNATANSPPPQPAGRPADTADSVSSLASGIGSSMMQFDEFKERALKNVTQTSSGITGRAHDPRNHKEVLDAETVKDLEVVNAFVGAGFNTALRMMGAPANGQVAPPVAPFPNAPRPTDGRLINSAEAAGSLLANVAAGHYGQPITDAGAMPQAAAGNAPGVGHLASPANIPAVQAATKNIKMTPAFSAASAAVHTATDGHGYAANSLFGGDSPGATTGLANTTGGGALSGAATYGGGQGGAVMTASEFGQAELSEMDRKALEERLQRMGLSAREISKVKPVPVGFGPAQPRALETAEGGDVEEDETPMALIAGCDCEAYPEGMGCGIAGVKISCLSYKVFDTQNNGKEEASMWDVLEAMEAASEENVDNVILTGWFGGAIARAGPRVMREALKRMSDDQGTNFVLPAAVATGDGEGTACDNLTGINAMCVGMVDENGRSPRPARGSPTTSPIFATDQALAPMNADGQMGIVEGMSAAVGQALGVMNMVQGLTKGADWGELDATEITQRQLAMLVNTDRKVTGGEDEEEEGGGFGLPQGGRRQLTEVPRGGGRRGSLDGHGGGHSRTGSGAPKRALGTALDAGYAVENAVYKAEGVVEGAALCRLQNTMLVGTPFDVRVVDGVEGCQSRCSSSERVECVYFTFIPRRSLCYQYDKYGVAGMKDQLAAISGLRECPADNSPEARNAMESRMHAGLAVVQAASAPGAATDLHRVPVVPLEVQGGVSGKRKQAAEAAGNMGGQGVNFVTDEFHLANGVGASGNGPPGGWNPESYYMGLGTMPAITDPSGERAAGSTAAVNFINSSPYRMAEGPMTTSSEAARRYAVEHPSGRNLDGRINRGGGGSGALKQAVAGAGAGLAGVGSAVPVAGYQGAVSGIPGANDAAGGGTGDVIGRGAALFGAVADPEHAAVPGAAPLLTMGLPADNFVSQMNDAVQAGNPNAPPMMEGQSLLGGAAGAAGGMGGFASGAASFVNTASMMMQAGNKFMQVVPVGQMAKAGTQLYNSGFFRNRGMRSLNGPALGLEKQSLRPPPGLPDPRGKCMTVGVTCCAPREAADNYRTNPPLLNGVDSRKCQANYVAATDELCATTAFDSDVCGMKVIETEEFRLYQNHLVMPGRTMNNVICNCKQNKIPDEQGRHATEGYATWEYSLQAVEADATGGTAEQTQANVGKFAKGAQTALAWSQMLGAKQNGAMSGGGEMISQVQADSNSNAFQTVATVPGLQGAGSDQGRRLIPAEGRAGGVVERVLMVENDEDAEILGVSSDGFGEQPCVVPWPNKCQVWRAECEEDVALAEMDPRCVPIDAVVDGCPMAELEFSVTDVQPGIMAYAMKTFSFSGGGPMRVACQYGLRSCAEANVEAACGVTTSGVDGTFVKHSGRQPPGVPNGGRKGQKLVGEGFRGEGFLSHDQVRIGAIKGRALEVESLPSGSLNHATADNGTGVEVHHVQNLQAALEGGVGESALAEEAKLESLSVVGQKLAEGAREPGPDLLVLFDGAGGALVETWKSLSGGQQLGGAELKTVDKNVIQELLSDRGVWLVERLVDGRREFDFRTPSSLIPQSWSDVGGPQRRLREGGRFSVDRHQSELAQKLGARGKDKTSSSSAHLLENGGEGKMIEVANLEGFQFWTKTEVQFPKGYEPGLLLDKFQRDADGNVVEAAMRPVGSGK